MQGELEKLTGPKPAAQKIASGFGSVAGPVFAGSDILYSVMRGRTAL